MFRNLHVLPGKNDVELERRRAEVLEKITSAEGSTIQAQLTLAETQTKVETARVEVTRATEDLSSAQKEVAEKAQALVNSTSEAEGARQEMETALQELGESTGTNAGAVIDLALSPLTASQAVRGVQEAAAEFTRTLKDWRKFLSSLFSSRGAIVLALCLAAPVVAWMADWLNKRWAAVAGGAATGFATIRYGINFLRERRKEFEAKLQELERKEEESLEARRSELEERRKQLQAIWDQKLSVLREGLEQQRKSLASQEESVRNAVQRLTELNKEFEEKVRARVSAEQKLQALQNDLKKLSSALLLDEFLKDRSGTNEYRKELGFLALVRRDFERLSDLIAAANDEWCSPDRTTPPPLLNRIVLYIDDLDRCRVDTVIKVLEAVHLLLAFPLFVCVVAVDPRWIEQCLREKHSDLFSEKQKGNNMHVTVGDYLEKIFQIPIWMQPMENRERSALVKTLLGTTAAPGAKAASMAQGSTGPTNTASDAGVEHGSAADGFQATVKKAEDTADPLSISPEESDFVERLAPLLSDKPRAIKRFVNTYRLLKASLSDIDRQTFVSDDPFSPYKICMSQLAFFTGQPRLAPVLVRQFTPTGKGYLSLKNWSETLESPERESLQQILDLFPVFDRERLVEFGKWVSVTSMYLFHRDD